MALTLHEVALLRIAAQRLAGPDFATATDAVRWMTALQAQDFQGALTSVALRTASPSRQGVVAALDAGEVVRSWPMRGTLHLVPAEDLVWMLHLMAPRVVAGAAARHAELGLDSHQLDMARGLAVAALSGGRQLRRAELLELWEERGLATAGQRGYHLLGHLAQTGTLCLGPVREREQLFVLVDEWIARPRLLEREEALGELALRYFRSHGPATVKDFTKWTNLFAADVRAGLALARPHLTGIDVDGVEHLMDPHTPARLNANRALARDVLLLPGFDELILGYQDRRAVLAAEFAARIVPGRNGVFQPTVVSDGRVVGTWKHAGRGAQRTVTATPFTPLPADVAAAVGQVYERMP